MIRDSIQTIAALGVLPAEDDADVDTVKRWQQAIEAIPRPVTNEEAVVLMDALPRAEDDCFGLAWTLVHACETAQDYNSELVARSTLTGEWREQLLDRLRNAGR